MNSKKLLIEVKGARANDDSPIKKREYFSSGQIKTHFGRAIVKALEDKYLHPKAKIAIAHPDDSAIRSTIDHLIPSLHKIGISHFWVSSDGSVIEQVAFDFV